MRPIALIGCLAAAAACQFMPNVASADAYVQPATGRAGHTHRNRLGRHAQRARHATDASAQAPITVPAATGTTYYVSPNGSDANPGTSPASAWQTVRRVDDAKLEHGDEVLFQAGATFSDEALMPGWGENTSGTSAAPIVFGSYGVGQATITQGVWFQSDDYLAFRELTLGTDGGYEGAGFQGNGRGITILRTTIEHAELGINAAGDDWTIAGNTIDDTGDSGMLLGYTADTPGRPAGGSDYLVTGNTVSNTGLNTAIPYGTHGIYDKVADSTITDNTISHFRDDGISVRYRNNTISGNRLSYGDIGLAWFQYDTAAGTSKWTGNSISNVSSAGIFVCGTEQGCLQPLESFQISGNTITAFAGTEMNLQPTTGTYSRLSGAGAAGAKVNAPREAGRTSANRRARARRAAPQLPRRPGHRGLHRRRHSRRRRVAAK
jgi:parallel beta-helix repeat protein